MEYREMNCKQAGINIWLRFLNMISKMVGMKGVVLFLTIWLIVKKHFPAEAIAYVWIAVMLIVVFGEKALNVIKDIKK